MLNRQQLSFVFFAIVMIVGVFLSWTNGSEIPKIEPRVMATSTVPVVLTPVSTTAAVTIRWPEVVTSSARVTRVVDWDTVDVVMDGEIKAVRIRLLGINTPESIDPRRPVECFAKEASSYLKTLIEQKHVALLEDTQADDRDKYGRLLRNLVLEDQTDVSATLVANGYAHAYLSFPLTLNRKAQLRLLESRAQGEARGLWSPVTCNGEVN